MAPPSPAVRTWIGLRRFDALLGNALDEALRIDTGLTLPEHDVLRQVHEAGGQIQMGDLARILVLSRSGITRLVAKLETDRYVERITFPQNRRATFARLTDTGTAILATCTGTFKRVLDDQLAAHLGPDDLATLDRILTTALDAQGWCDTSSCPTWAATGTTDRT